MTAAGDRGSRSAAGELITRRLFASALVGLGALTYFRGDLPLSSLDTPTLVAGRTVLAGCLCAAIWLLAIGIWRRRPGPVATWAVLGFTSIWWLWFKLGPLLAAPLVELSWLEVGMFAMVVLASGVLEWWRRRAEGGGTNRVDEAFVRALPYLYGAALLPIGLSHYFYRDITLTMVPKVLPVPMAWVALGGVAHFAAGLGILFNVKRRLAAVLEAAMLTAFAVLVWIPGVVSAPHDPRQWSELLLTWLIAAAAWVLAESTPTTLGSDRVAGQRHHPTPIARRGTPASGRSPA